ncbi:hypothetical protein H257_14273 [Aphanomyces astaci]|uniref:Uncharacterized protein n=1 Tax=Aphanomyces astaci TaxID=112090 RepID=W4FRX3_APHAT|nr:hypothetical protein H257_14273 [Aphanomyces astaci]ETV70250.1 hypothetical protein H257_14273 [Aphanomyces astaci]|eukprot:XP_009840346.1 hypothetical protein H257_14273 [Aphanomyces astaci]
MPPRYILTVRGERYKNSSGEKPSLRMTAVISRVPGGRIDSGELSTSLPAMTTRFRSIPG